MNQPFLFIEIFKLQLTVLLANISYQSLSCFFCSFYNKNIVLKSGITQL